MQRFIITLKLTDVGAEYAERLPQFCSAVIALWKEAGGELEHLDLTLGDADFIASGTFPSLKAALQFSMAVSSDGAVRAKTIPAFDHRDVGEALVLLPKVHGTLLPEKKLRGDD